MIVEGFAAVHSLRLAEVSFPRSHPRDGQTGPVNAFLIRHPEGPVLIDTGIGPAHTEIDAMYRPVRHPLPEALAALGTAVSDIRLVINTHLHFDHCGGNHLFAGVPTAVQRTEMDAAQAGDYTVREWVNFPGANYWLLDGEAELGRGLRAIPTPGHTAGHQSIAIETADGIILIAGQAAETAAAFDRPELDQAGPEDPEEYLASLARLRALNPAKVLFSHDPATWTPRHSL